MTSVGQIMIVVAASLVVTACEQSSPNVPLTEDNLVRIACDDAEKSFTDACRALNDCNEEPGCGSPTWNSCADDARALWQHCTQFTRSPQHAEESR